MLRSYFAWMLQCCSHERLGFSVVLEIKIGFHHEKLFDLCAQPQFSIFMEVGVE